MGPMGPELEWECPISIARENGTDINASGLQFTLSFNPKETLFVGMKDLLCFEGAGCFDVDVAGPGGLPLSTGHQVSMAPLEAAGWDIQSCDQNTPCPEESCVEGSGFNGWLWWIHHRTYGDSQTPLNTAFMTENGTVNGDPVIARIVFQNKPENTSQPNHHRRFHYVGSDGSNLQLTLRKSFSQNLEPGFATVKEGV